MQKTLLFYFIINFIKVNGQYGNVSNASNTSTNISSTTTTHIYTTSPAKSTTTTTPLPTTTTIEPTTTIAPTTTTTIAQTTTYLRTTVRPTTTTNPTSTTKHYDKTTTPQSTTTHAPVTTTQIKKPIIYCSNETWNVSCMQCFGPLCKFVENSEQGVGWEILFVIAFIAFIGLAGLLIYTKCIKSILYHNIGNDIYFDDDDDDSDFDDEAMPLNMFQLRQHKINTSFEIENND